MQPHLRDEISRCDVTLRGWFATLPRASCLARLGHCANGFGSMLHLLFRPVFGLLAASMVVIASGCATSSPIQRASESTSAFGEPPVLSKHEYPDADVYRIYHRASSGMVSIQSIRQAAEQRAEEFARRQGKSFVVLGEKISQPPYILGNFPRIEIVFALIPRVEAKGAPAAAAASSDKYADLERLKKLMDSGALTKEEFEREKAKLLK